MSRILAKQAGYFVCTILDRSKNSYLRVRHCALARVIENECYVVIAGSVGNLPEVEA